MRALAVLLALTLVGCLRVGPGEDLSLVCEEKTGSPRMAYGLDFLAAQTRVNGSLTPDQKLAILEGARHHVITMGGAPHAAFDAELSKNGSAWTFDATGLWDNATPDRYHVEISGDPPQAPTIAIPPASIAGIAMRVANATGSLAWDPALASCVAVTTTAQTITVNVVEQRVVLIHSLS